MFWIIVAYICTLMTFSFIGAHILRISNYVLIRLTMTYGKLTTGLIPMVYINLSKCLLLSRTKRAFDGPDIIIKGNKNDFVRSASNLGIIFNGRLTRSNHINVIAGKVYGMLRNCYIFDSFCHTHATGQNVFDSCALIRI